MRKVAVKILLSLLVGALPYQVSLGAVKKPFRLGVLRINPAIDKVKPLAEADYSGWAVAGDTLIGAVDDKWVAGYSIDKERITWWLEAETPLAAPVVNLSSWVILGFRSGKLMKVEAETGTKVWEVNLDSLTPRQVVLVGSRLLVFTASQQLYSLDFQTGSTGWLYDAGFPEDLTIGGSAPPVVHEDKVIIGLSSGEIQALNIETGKLLWNYDPEITDTRFRDVVGEMAVKDQRLLISRYDGIVAAIDLSGNDRTQVWNEALPTVATSVFRSGVFIVGCLNGDVIAFETNTGKRLWRVETGQAVSTLSAGENVIYVTGANGRINSLEAATGSVLWYDDIGAELVRKPLFFADGIFFSTGFKNLYGYLLD